MAKHLLVGVAKADITPQQPVPMAGYRSRTAWSAGVHDSLAARCFVFLYGHEVGALIVLDLLGIHEHWANEVKRQTAEMLDCDPGRVVVTCAHTHSGPAGAEIPPQAEQVLPKTIEVILTNTKLAVEKAIKKLSPVQVGTSTCSLTGIAGHRHFRNRRVDQTLWVTSFRTPRGTLTGVLANFPVHSTVLGPENRFLSGDLLGVAATFAEECLGPNVVVGLTCGAAGDISTRFFRQSQGFDELHRLAKLLANAIVELVQEINYTWSAEFAVRRRQCWLPYKTAPSIERVREIIALRKAALNRLLQKTEVEHGELRLARTELEGAELLLDFVRKKSASGGAEASVVGMRIGRGILIGLPGEPFNVLAQILRNNTPEGFLTTVMGLTDGYLGYFPDREAVENSWYEALASPFDHRAIEILAENAQALLRELVQNKNI